MVDVLEDPGNLSWIVDIHQPLHVSYADDLGGNKIDQNSGGPCDWSLHSVWDTCIIEAELGANYQSVSQKLRSSIEEWQRENWIDSTPVDWADESYDNLET